jgi:hypothetical protein
MTREDMLALADRVESLTGPDREVDWLIADALGEVPEHVIQGTVGTPYGWFRREDQWSLTRTKESDVYAGVESWSPKPRTASLDAAMSLVPEGWSVGIGHLPGADWKIRAHLRDHRSQSLTKDGHSHIWVEGHHANCFALALVAAALLARAEALP